MNDKKKMENTSYISQISYNIESWRYKGLNYEDINYIINDLQEKEQFPANLQYIDSYSSHFSSSGCAFQDINTGNVIVGFAGTNQDVSLLNSVGDIAADAAIASLGMSPNSPYLAHANVFIKGLENKGYTVNQVTGHSLGGAQAVGVALENNIPSCVTYNSAPSHVPITTALPHGHQTALDTMYKFARYKGEIIRLTTDNDPLNNLAELGLSIYPGESRIIIDNGGGHGINAFLGGVTQDYISRILGQEADVFSVDADKDGKLDVTVQASSFVARNLFSSGSIDDSHGKLSSDANITPLSDSFSSAMYYCSHYQKNIYEMRNTFKTLVEKAVYESYELDGIISAQNLISRMIMRMSQELQSVSSQISSQFKGNSFDKYQTHINSAINLLGYFNTLLDDCFGVKMSAAA